MEIDRIRHYKSSFFERKEKAEKVTEKAKRIFNKFASDEFSSSLPKTPEYKKRMILAEIEHKIAENSPKITTYLHEGAQAKKPHSPDKSQMSPNPSGIVNKPRNTIFTQIINLANAVPKLVERKDYFPDIKKKFNQIDRRSSWKVIKHKKGYGINQKYKELMQQSDHYKHESQH